MTIEAVCFDLDDTLYQYERYARAGLENAGEYLEAHTGQQHHETLLELYFDEEVTEGTFDVLIDRYDLPTDIVDALIEAYHDADRPLESYPGTVPVLSRLEGVYQLGLITDGRGGHAKLRRLGIVEYFGAVLVTPTIGRSKHDRIAFDRVLSELSVSPPTAVYVGDDPRVDFGVPNELGMVTVRLRRGRYTHLEPPDESAEPDHEIRYLGELLPIVFAEG